MEIELVLINLVRNAQQSLKTLDVKHPFIEVSLGEEQGDAVLIVQDNGDISEEKIKNLSEPMSSAKKEGLGLGLAIVKAIVENHAGSISFQKSELGGLKVMVRIPILKTENKMKKNKVEPLIRIVDDEASMRRALTILLEMEGWKVTCYSSAKEFLAEDAPSVPGCVISDVSMPEVTWIAASFPFSRKRV